MGVGGIQKGVHIFCVVLHFLGKKLRPAREVPGKIPDYQTGHHQEFYPAVQIVIGHGLEPVAVDEIPHEGQGAAVPGADGKLVQSGCGKYISRGRYESIR